jgi:hypothetical protein
MTLRARKQKNKGRGLGLKKGKTRLVLNRFHDRMGENNAVKP